MIQVGGYKLSTVVDFEIPKKYGLRQTIANTMGIGGIMRALRTVPVLVDICRDARPTHEGGAGPGPDLEPGGRADRSARRLAAGVSLTEGAALPIQAIAV